MFYRYDFLRTLRRRYKKYYFTAQETSSRPYNRTLVQVDLHITEHARTHARTHTLSNKISLTTFALARNMLNGDLFRTLQKIMDTTVCTYTQGWR